MLDDITDIAKANICSFIGLDSAFHREDAHCFYEKEEFNKPGYFFFKEIIQIRIRWMDSCAPAPHVLLMFVLVWYT